MAEPLKIIYILYPLKTVETIDQALYGGLA